MSSTYRDFSDHVSQNFSPGSNKSVKTHTRFLVKFILVQAAPEQFSPDFISLLQNTNGNPLNLDEIIQASASYQDINDIESFLSSFLNPQGLVTLQRAFHVVTQQGIECWEEFIRLLCICLTLSEDLNILNN